MANLRRWSSSASGNASVAGGANTINFAEGQTPGSVNNSAREMMAQIRGIYTPSEWGWVEFSATASVASQTTFKLAGNQTTDWVAPRRWRLKSGSSTRYGTVVSSSYTVETTVTVTVDSGSLSASHSLAALAVIDSNHVPAIYGRLAGTNTYSANQIIEVTDNTNAALRVTQLGTGLALRVEDSANPDSTPTVIAAGGEVGIGTASPEVKLHVAGNIMSRSGTDGYNMIVIGNATVSGYMGAYNASGVRQGYFGYFDGTNLVAAMADSTQSVFIGNNGTNRFAINGSGDAVYISSGGLGYGTGSGGTVTQITSKATGVTLNKTNGQIITHNASLGAASEVSFTVTNSTVAATDNIILTKVSGGTATRYQLYVGAVAAGSFVVSIRNVDSTAQSDVITFNFAVIKSVTS